MHALFSLVAGVIVLLAWGHDPLLGIRACGAFTVLEGSYRLYLGRIPFHFNARHLVDLDGLPAYLLAAAVLALGFLLMLFPGQVVSMFHPAITYVFPR